MSDPYVAEVRIFAGNFAPVGWAFCDGQLLPISQNTALFSLVGTTYGGDGRSNFALPDLRGRAALHAGQGQGLSARSLGEAGGSASVTLTGEQIPAHSHSLVASASPGSQAVPAGGLPAADGTKTSMLYSSAPADGSMAPGALAFSGGGEPHENRSPYLGLSFIIALQGIFPPRG